MPREMRRQHGTATGYKQHAKAGERPCESCRAAHAMACAAWRDRNKTYVLETSRNYMRAMYTLRDRHLDEFHRLLVEEQTK